MSKKLSESAENGMSSSLTIDMASSLQKMSINSGPHDDNDDTMKQLLCEIFGLTIRPDDHHHQPLVLIESESAEHAVFERLMLAEPETKLVRPSSSKKSTQLDSHFVQTDVISYLFECYRRILQREKSANAKHITELKRIVLRNVNTILQEPALFETQEVHKQFLDLFMETYIENELKSFLNQVVTEALSEDGTDQSTINEMFTPILNLLSKQVSTQNLYTYQKHWLFFMQILSTNSHLGKLLMEFNIPKTNSKSYGLTLFGQFLSMSCLPKENNSPILPFEITDDTDVNVALNQLTLGIHKIFYNLLKHSPEVHHAVMNWIADCLEVNASRGQLWNMHNEMMYVSPVIVSDGFMLNLNSVLLKLCDPFSSIDLKNGVNNKLLKIDPTYCAVEPLSDEERKRRKVHILNMHTQTCLIPTPEGESRPKSEMFNFITECFFLTHRSLDLGYRVVLDRFMKHNQTIARLQNILANAQNSASGEILERLTESIKFEYNRYLALRASLLPIDMLNSLGKFHATTAAWLMQVYLNTEPVTENNVTSYAPKEFKKVELPIPDDVPDTVRCIPEFLVENTVGFLGFVRYAVPNLIEQLGPSFLNPVLTQIVVQMESSQKLYNPHHRARLAEGLEAILPTNKNVVKQPIPDQGAEHRKQLFLTHPLRQQIVVSLTHVFVSIEMTGQSVQFEQKFNYRRPMYIVMAYLWKIPEHRQVFKSLAEDAEANMEAVQPPLFLRFINLLINDAVFLLDDALSNMAQLRQLHQKKESDEWNNLSLEERDEQLRNLELIGSIARFDNILGKATISTLSMLTTEIKSIFCHPTMVDRIVAMLNYLLLKLVGPNQKNFKVKQREEYSFDPASLVLNICKIYINLSNSKAFTLSVSQDGRSYSPQLFEQAISVLARIDDIGIRNDLEQFATAVQEAARFKMEEDEILVDAPEEFLDPIMSTLMSDPVILPSSKITIDRQTIARHLLSDQTDPFNRSPLTMNMVKPNEELSNQIKDWIAKKKQQLSSTSDSAE